MQAPQQAQQAPARTPIEYIMGYVANVQADLKKIEADIADMELNYFQAEHSQAGNVLKGLDGYLSSKEALRKRSRSWRPEDRLFSLSSRTSPVTQEQMQVEEVDAMASGGFGKKGYAQKGYPAKGKR